MLKIVYKFFYIEKSFFIGVENVKKPVLLIGAGGHAKVLIELIHQSDDYYIEAVIGRNDEIHEEIMGYKILKGDIYLADYKAKGINLVAIGIGGYTNNNKRKDLFRNLKNDGYKIINLVHPSAIVSQSVVLGEGVVIFSGVTINTEVIIGDNTVIATGANIDHETIIEDHVLISAGVTVGAGNIIKQGALLALGANVISRVVIGENTLVAAGAVVVSNVAKDTVVYGIPAKEKR